MVNINSEKLSISLSFIDYLILSYTLFSFLLIPDIIKNTLILGFILSPTIFLLPILFGKSIWVILMRFKLASSSSYLIFFFLGSSLLTTLCIFFQIFRLPVTLAYYIMITTISIAFITDILKNFPKVNFLLITHYNKVIFDIKFVAVVISLAIGTIPAMIIGTTRPIGTVGVDHSAGVEFIQPINRILEYGIVDYWKTRSLPVIIAAIVPFFTNKAILPIDLYWILPFLLSSLFTLGVFLLAYEITRKIEISIVASLFSAFLNLGHGVFFDAVSHIFRYQTLITAFFPFVLCYVYRYETAMISKGGDVFSLIHKLLFIPTLALLPLSISFIKPKVFMHILQREEVTPILMVITLLFLLFYGRKLSMEESKNLWFLSGIFLLFIIICDPLQPLVFNILPLFILMYFLVLVERVGTTLSRILMSIFLIYIILVISNIITLSNVPAPIERLSVYVSYTQSFKSEALFKANSRLVISIFLGFLLTLILLIKNNRAILCVVFMTITYLLLYFMPTTVTMPLPHHGLNIFMAITIAIGLYKVVMLMGRGVSRFFSINLADTKVKATLLVIYLLASLFFLNPVFTSFNERFSWKPSGAMFRSIFTDYELEAMNFIRTKIPSDVRIISDPFTMRTFTSLTNRQWLIESKMLAPAFTDEGKKILQVIKNDVLLARDGDHAYEAIKKLKAIVPYDEKMFLELSGEHVSGKFIVVISGRTDWWLRAKGINWEYWFPFTYHLEREHVNIFLNNSHFKPLFIREGKIYIFSVDE